jgi:hypothetical protein
LLTKGEVGEVVGGEHKMLLCRVWPQHGHDRLVRETSDERCAPRRRRQGIELSRSGEGATDDGLRRPGVDEAKGAKTHGGPGS